MNYFITCLRCLESEQRVNKRFFKFYSNVVCYNIHFKYKKIHPKHTLGLCRSCSEIVPYNSKCWENIPITTIHISYCPDIMTLLRKKIPRILLKK